MNLSQALAALSRACTPTPRFMTVPIVLSAGRASAYNGEVAACVPYEGDHAPVALDSAKLAKTWTADSKLKVSDVFAVVTRKGVQFRLLKVPHETIFFPEFVADSVPLNPLLRDAIHLAAKFASTNALHAWACGVSIDPTGVTATNNQTLVRVPCESNDMRLTLPFWAIKALDDSGTPPRIGWNEGSVCFEYENGLKIQAQRLSAEMPDLVGNLAAQALPGNVPIQTSGLSAALEQLVAIEGKFCLIENGQMSIVGSDGEEAIADIGLIEGSFKMSVETAKLVFAHATHLSFARADEYKLMFSKDTYPQMMGFATGAR